MTLEVEDGTGKANAESYISVSDASTYHTARGNSAWGALASDTVREQCLRKATEFMLQMYRGRWQGIRTLSTQALDWPRYEVVVDEYVVASGIVPTEVARACAELALKASAGTLLADLTQAKTRVKVGSIETEYNPHSPQVKRYPAIDAMLAPYLTGSAGALKGVRS